MKKSTLITICIIISISISAQNNIDFDTTGQGWTWSVFANSIYDATACLNIVPNPFQTGINTSDHVLQFLINQNGDPWAGFYSLDIEDFTFNSSNKIVRLMVYKSVLSKTSLKFEGSSDPAPEIADSNSVLNEWQTLTYDFTDYIGYSYPKISVFPDYRSGRTEDEIVYIDNITFMEEIPTSIINREETKIHVFPNPAREYITITGVDDLTEVVIYTITGKKIAGYANTDYDLKNLDISSYNKGIYILAVITSKEVITTKFVKN